MKTFLQLNTIFISMVIEAIPFVLLGVFISGIIQIFVTERMIARIMPKNRVLAILMACLLGFCFPACECGIVPIVRRLVVKGVPLHAGIAFMLTAPIINPVVLFATFIAFGNDWRMVFIRGGFALIVAFLTSLLISFVFKENQLREKFLGQVPANGAHLIHEHGTHKQALQVHGMQEQGAHELVRKQEDPEAAGLPQQTLRSKLMDTCLHAIDEFFSVGKFLLVGAFVAASMQTFLKTQTLVDIGHNQLTASLVMMAMAFILSLCSEADAFIASSFRSTFSVGALSAFLVFGPMIDIKNTLMLFATFKTKFVVTLISSVAVIVLVGSMLL